ncbi:hypothetical protein [uncultured Alsobacter sp.]|uniref:hypothetical protein n=1 Tax=uncultured Alsobacter sp. TaxID=1748258 RepID=UPI0025F76EF7|nr:hypothetical protein [uncultured Alsobacter sp.]
MMGKTIYAVVAVYSDGSGKPLPIAAFHEKTQADRLATVINDLDPGRQMVVLPFPVMVFADEADVEVKP